MLYHCIINKLIAFCQRQNVYLVVTGTHFITPDMFWNSRFIPKEDSYWRITTYVWITIIDISSLNAVYILRWELNSSAIYTHLMLFVFMSRLPDCACLFVPQCDNLVLLYICI
jgi:hypothetical protein